MQITVLDENPPAAQVTAPVLQARDIATRAVGRGYSVSWRDVDGASETTLTLRPPQQLPEAALRAEIADLCTPA
jgi:hypothetical protein